MIPSKVLSKTVYSQSPTVLIIPYHILEWQIDLNKRREELDAEWQRLHLIEGSLLRALNQDWEEREHDWLFSRLDQVRQKMTDLQFEIERGPDWTINGYEGDYDE